jgi:hypothetical protein
MLREFAPRVWIAEHPQLFLGAEVGTRMTVVQLDGGGLLIHSPIKFTPDIRAELVALGEVRFIVAPNRFHHLYVADYVREYPSAELYCAPGLDRKRPDLKGVTLSDSPPAAWAGQIDQYFFRAFPGLNEIDFFHRASRTLIMTDLIFNLTAPKPGWTRFLMTLDGAADGPAVARSFRLLMRFRKAECRAAVQRMLQWDFERIIVTHGDPIVRNAKRAFAEAWSFLG